MTIPEVVSELGEVKAEVSASIQHALLRLAKCKQELVGMNNPALQPVIDALTSMEGSYRVFLM
jgi:hypothetical protein